MAVFERDHVHLESLQKRPDLRRHGGIVRPETAWQRLKHDKAADEIGVGGAEGGGEGHRLIG